jgi:hypothetical protein
MLQRRESRVNKKIMASFYPREPHQRNAEMQTDLADRFCPLCILLCIDERGKCFRCRAHYARVWSAKETKTILRMHPFCAHVFMHPLQKCIRLSLYSMCAYNGSVRTKTCYARLHKIKVHLEPLESASCSATSCLLIKIIRTRLAGIIFVCKPTNDFARALLLVNWFFIWHMCFVVVF